MTSNVEGKARGNGPCPADHLSTQETDVAKTTDQTRLGAVLAALQREPILRTELDKSQNRAATLHETLGEMRETIRLGQADLRRAENRINDLCLSLQEEWDVNAGLRETIGRLVDTIENLRGTA